MSKERHPPLRIQHDKGYRAFKRGRIINPYKQGSSFYKEWERGFNDFEGDYIDFIMDHLKNH